VSKTLREAFKDMGKVLELAEKPDADEFKQILKLTLLGFTLTGLISFGIATGLYYLMTALGIASIS